MRCGHQRISYNSCRDRHCPKCQNTKRAQWLAERVERLLPVPYWVRILQDKGNGRNFSRLATGAKDKGAIAG